MWVVWAHPTENHRNHNQDLTFLHTFELLSTPSVLSITSISRPRNTQKKQVPAFYQSCTLTQALGCYLICFFINFIVQRTHPTVAYLMHFQSYSILTLGCHSTTAKLPLQLIFACKRAKNEPSYMQKSWYQMATIDSRERSLPRVYARHMSIEDSIVCLMSFLWLSQGQQKAMSLDRCFLQQLRQQQPKVWPATLTLHQICQESHPHRNRKRSKSLQNVWVRDVFFLQV